jgi:hypothetical protein
MELAHTHRTFLAPNAAWHLKGDIKYVNKSAWARRAAWTHYLQAKFTSSVNGAIEFSIKGVEKSAAAGLRNHYLCHKMFLLRDDFFFVDQ